MALYAFDGTGNDDRPDTEQDGWDSNVLHFFRAYQDPGKDFVEGRDTGSLYLRGIGRRAETHTGTVVSQAFGVGGHIRVGIMMDRLAGNLAAGDETVDIIGFSRGAALAVSFANELARRFPGLAVRFLGLWDIVGQFGLPGQFVNAGHDLRMPRTVVRSYHAMALDERRTAFPLTRLDRGRRPVDPRLAEVWFRGVHSDVGGGNGNFGLNWISLDWMYASGLREGLPIDPAAVAANRAHGAHLQDILEHKLAVGPKRKIFAGDLVHVSVELNPGPDGPQRNDPSLLARRVDNDGVIRNA